MELSGNVNYIVHLFIYAIAFIVPALALNLAVGYTGMLSVCQIAFSGIAGYTTAILMTMHGFSFLESMLASVATASITAFVLGLVLTRVRGDYFALATVGFNIIVVSVLNNWESLTRGPFGIPGIPSPVIFGYTVSSKLDYLFLSLIILAIVYGVCTYITRSDFGRALKAVRDDETALQIFGYNTRYYKLIIFTIAAALGALSESLWVTFVSYTDPTSYRLDNSILVLSMVIFGGLASNKGAVWGAFILVLLPEALRFVGFPDSIAAQMRIFVYGALLVVLMLYRPQGMVGEYKL